MSHDQITQFPDYVFTLLLGVVLLFGWIATVFLTWAWMRTWHWIDDTEASDENPAIKFVMGILGYTKDNGRWAVWAYTHQKLGSSDGHIGFFLPCAIALLGPSIVRAAFDLYPLTIAAATLFLMAHLARFARRHKKLFDKHIADPDAHKS